MAAIFPIGHFPVERSSKRPSKPANPFGRGVVVCEGHGELVKVGGVDPTFPVPDGIEIVIFQGMGAGLADGHGVVIGQGRGLPARLPTTWDAGSAEYDTSAHGAVRANTPGRKVYYGGETCPDLTLYAYDEDGFPAITAPQPGSFFVRKGTTITLRAICDLFKDEGAQLHWAACTVFR